MPIFQDGTISIMPVTWGSIQAGYAVNGIDILSSIQPPTSIKIIDQILDTFSVSSGVVNNTDSIVQAIQKLAGALSNAYTGIHITSGSSSTTNLAAYERGVIFDSGVTGKTVKLRSVSDPDVIPWVPYPFLVGSGVITSNTIGVQTGESLNNTVNGTYTIAGLLSGWVWVNAICDGTGWFIAP